MNFDLLVIIIFSLSCIFGFLKGFIKSLISLSNLILSIILTYYLYPLLKPFFLPFIEGKLAVTIASGISAYIVSLLLIYIFIHRINHWTKNIQGGAFDKFLGMMFGAIRGLLFVSIIYSLFTGFANFLHFKKDENGHLKILKESKTAPVIASCLKYYHSFGE